jgi:hypothetical protein
MSEQVFIPVKSRAERYRFWGGVLGILALVTVGWIVTMREVVANAFANVRTDVIDTKSCLERLDETPASSPAPTTD